MKRLHYISFILGTTIRNVSFSQLFHLAQTLIAWFVCKLFDSEDDSLWSQVFETSVTTDDHTRRTSHCYIYTSVSLLEAGFRGGITSTVIWAGLVVLAKVTVWHVPCHDSFHSADQLRETGASIWIFPPAFIHQFIAVKRRRKTKSKTARKTNSSSFLMLCILLQQFFTMNINPWKRRYYVIMTSLSSYK